MVAGGGLVEPTTSELNQGKSVRDGELENVMSDANGQDPKERGGAGGWHRTIHVDVAACIRAILWPTAIALLAYLAGPAAISPIAQFARIALNS